MDLSPVILNQLTGIQKNELASLLTKVGSISDLSSEQKSILEALKAQKSNDDLSNEIAGLKSTVKAVTGIGVCKTVEIVPLKNIYASTSSSSPSIIRPPAGCRLKIQLLAMNYGSTISHTQSAQTFEIYLGNTPLVSAASSQRLSGVLNGPTNTYRWFGNYFSKTRTTSSNVDVPVFFSSSFGCPVGGIDEPLSMYSTSSSNTYRQIFLAYEVIKDV